jgi:integrase
MDDDTSGPLWIGVTGEPLSYSNVNVVITETTQQCLGVAVNPHAFRVAAASTAAYRAANSPDLASALLQHTDRRTTDAHYNRATSLQSGIELGRIIRGLTR